jgi:DNA-binding CsgD family transcriptional regulator
VHCLLSPITDCFAPSLPSPLEVLEGLVSGRYALVREFATAGQHHWVVRSTPGANCRPLLSRRQRQIVGLALVGQSNKQIAAELGLSTGTVAAHLSAAMHKLGVKSRAELVAHFV